MSLAYSLVNSLAASQPNEDDKTLVIDHYSRRIIIPSGIKSLGVENDDDVLRLNFRMPRYLGTVDLHKFNIYINYINAQGKDDIYSVDDATIVGDDVMFSWLVGPIATAYIGTTAFNVRMTIADSNSIVKQEYNTAVAKLQVLEGLKCSKRAISKYSDILAQWERKLFGVGDTEEAKLVAASEAQQAAIVNKGNEVLATIPEEYQITSDLANKGARTKADAIICSAEGEVVKMEDSSDDQLRGLKIFGKTTQVKTTGAQVIPQPYYESDKTSNGVKFTVNTDGSITISGTSTATELASCYFTMHAGMSLSGTYTYKCYGLPSNCVTNIYYIGDVTGDAVKTMNFVEGNSYGFVIRVKPGATVNTTVYPMLVAGDTIKPYELYTGCVASPSPDYPQELVSVKNQTVNIYGKNLLKNIGTTDTINGVTFTVLSDGSIVMSGTASTNAYFHIASGRVFTPGSYVLSGCIGGGSSTHFLYLAKRGLYNFDGDTTFTVDEEYTDDVVIKVHSGVTMTNEVVRPMIRLASHADSTYEPYVDAQTVNSAYTISGVPVTSGGNYTDQNGQQWVCDEIDFEHGVYVKRIARLLFDGSENWGFYDYQSTYSGFSLHNAIDEIHSRTPGMSNQFHNFKQSVDDGIWVGVGNMSLYAISKEWYAKGLDAWKAHLSENPLEVIYPRNTPIETPLTMDEIAAFKALESHYPNTTVLNDSGAGMLVRYNADTETWIKNLIDEKIAAAVAKL